MEKRAAPLPSDPEYRTIKDLCDALNRSEATIHRYIRQGLPSYMVLGRRAFRWPEVEEWVRLTAETHDEEHTDEEDR